MATSTVENINYLCMVSNLKFERGGKNRFTHGVENGGSPKSSVEQRLTPGTENRGSPQKFSYKSRVEVHPRGGAPGGELIVDGSDSAQYVRYRTISVCPVGKIELRKAKNVRVLFKLEYLTCTVQYSL